MVKTAILAKGHLLQRKTHFSKLTIQRFDCGVNVVFHIRRNLFSLIRNKLNNLHFLSVERNARVERNHFPLELFFGTVMLAQYVDGFLLNNAAGESLPVRFFRIECRKAFPKTDGQFLHNVIAAVFGNGVAAQQFIGVMPDRLVFVIREAGIEVAGC